MKEIEEYTDKWKDILCSFIRRTIIIIHVLPKAMYRFNANSIKIPVVFFKEIEDTIFNLYGTIYKFVQMQNQVQVSTAIFRRRKKEQNWKHHGP